MTKRRKIAVRAPLKPSAEINVTPLVDVVLVLLIIFMVVTPLLEKNLDVRMPALEKVEDTAEVPPDQLVVRVGGAGELTIDDQPVEAAHYVEQLRGKLSKRKAGDKIVFVLADDRTNYAKLVSALDGAKAAGAETLGMMTETPEASGPAGDHVP